MNNFKLLAMVMINDKIVYEMDKPCFASPYIIANLYSIKLREPGVKMLVNKTVIYK